MSDFLQEAINKLRETTYIKSNEDFDSSLADIDKYATTDEQKAFMLGYLFKNKSFSTHISKDTEEFVIHAIKNENLQEYFYGEAQPEFDKIKSFAFIFLIVGIVAIVGGTIQLINGYYSVGIWMRYLAPVVHEGGTVIIIGLVLFIGGIMRYIYEKKKQKFMARLISKDK